MTPTQSPKGPRRGAPLFVYLFAGMALLSLLPVAVLGAVQSRRWEQSRLEEAADAQRVTAVEVARDVGESVDTSARALELVARTLEAEPTFDAGAARQALQALRREFPAFAALYVADADGLSLVAEPPVGADGRPAAGRSYRDRDYYLELKRTGATAVSSIQPGRATGVDSLQLAAPMFRDGTLVGYVAGSAKLSTISQAVAQVLAPRDVQVTVLDARGRALSPDGPQRPVMRPLGAQPLYRPLTQPEEARQGLDEQGRPVLAHAAAIEQRGLGWLALAVRPMASIQDEVAAARRQVLASGALTLLVGLLLSALVASRFARPIRQLAQMAREVAATGATQARPTGPAPREVAEVTEAVLHMIDRLQEQARALEHTVAERTAQLRASNQELALNLERLKETQARLATADRLASVGTLAAGVAHEINNPLSYVISNLSWVVEELGQGKPVGQPLLEALHEAHTGAERVRGIVRDLGTFARSSHDSTRSVDVVEVLRAALNVSRADLRHRARLVERLEPVPLVRADESRLGQVLLNLLVNAAQAIPEGAAERHQVRVATSTDAQGRAVLSVSDTGCGIAPENLGRIFEPFFTTKPVGHGTGLGLAICHGIMKALGGSIQVESEVGRGSTFTLLLPPAPTATTGSGRRPAPGPAQRGRLLVVDDEEKIGRSMERMLGLDHEVRWVPGARAALARLDAGERWDVILCDVMMPDMDAAELYQEVQRRHPEAAGRFLFITGGAFGTRGRTLVEAMANRCLGKPFEWPAVRAAIAAVLDGREPGG